MSVAIIEQSLVENLTATLDKNMRLIESLSAENKALKTKKLFTIKEVAAMVGLAPSTIRNHIHEFEYMPGSVKLIKRESVDKWIERGLIKPKIKTK